MVHLVWLEHWLFAISRVITPVNPIYFRPSIGAPCKTLFITSWCFEIFFTSKTPFGEDEPNLTNIVQVCGSTTN